MTVQIFLSLHRKTKFKGNFKAANGQVDVNRCAAISANGLYITLSINSTNFQCQQNVKGRVRMALYISSSKRAQIGCGRLKYLSVLAFSICFLNFRFLDVPLFILSTPLSTKTTRLISGPDPSPPNRILKTPTEKLKKWWCKICVGGT